MIDHGDLDEHAAAQALGPMLQRVVAQLEFCGPGAVATTGFAIDDVAYEVSVRVKPA